MWYALAVEHLEDAEVRFRLARLYDTGEGAPRNGMQAAALYRSVAELGHVEAQFRLARMYDAGDGIPQNEPLAAVWYRKAAEQGHAGAALETAMCYAKSRGVTKDALQAYTILQLHASLRNGETPEAGAESLKAALEGQLTPEQQARARKQAAALATRTQGQQD